MRIEPLKLPVQCVALPFLAPPRHEITIRAVLIGGPDQHFLVIAPQADEAVALIDLPPHQEVQDMLTVSPPINVVADKEKPSPPSGTNSFAGPKK